MTVPILPLDANTNTFSDWLIKTNLVIDAVANKIPSTDGTLSGNVAIDGSFQVDNLYVTRIYGGEIGNTGPVEISSNSVFTANVNFSSANSITMGSPSQYILSGSNTTHFVVAANTSTGRLRFVRGALMGSNNEGSFTANTGNFDTVNANTVNANTVNVSTAFITTVNAGSFSSNSTNVTYTGDITSNNNNFAIDTTLFDVISEDIVLAANTIDLAAMTIDISGETTFISSNVTIDANSNLIIAGLGNVKNEINSVRNDIIAFSIALG